MMPYPQINNFLLGSTNINESAPKDDTTMIFHSLIKLYHKVQICIKAAKITDKPCRLIPKQPHSYSKGPIIMN